VKRSTGLLGLLSLVVSCESSTVCDCLPQLVARGALRGTVVTSLQQPAPNSVVTFYASAGAICDLTNREPLLTSPGNQPLVLTDQAGGFVTGLGGIVTGPRCVWVAAKADVSATDSTLGTVVINFDLVDVPQDTASISLTLPAPLP
jgi:hypothetical protein